MKGKVLITVMIGLLLLSFLEISAFAQGIEPVPWHSQVNRLDSVMNNFDSIIRRLDFVLRPTNPNGEMIPASEGRKGRLEAMANELEVLNHKIMQTLSGVPMEPVPPQIEMVLMDINRAAMETEKMARMGLRDVNEGVRNAFMEVQMAAEMIIQTMEDWMMNPINVITPYDETQCFIGIDCDITWDTSNIQGWNFVYLKVVYPDGVDAGGQYPVPNDYTQSEALYKWVPDPSWDDPSVLCQPFRMKVFTMGDEWGVSGLFKIGKFPNVCNTPW